MFMNYNLSIKMAEAPPPPLQMLASPFCPGLRLCTMWPVIRAPDILFNNTQQIENVSRVEMVYKISINDKVKDK